MDTNLSFLRRGAGLICVGAILALPAARSSAADPAAQSDAFPLLDNYVKVSGLAPFMSGDKAAFTTRTGSPRNGVGGIEDLSYSEDLTKDSTLTINGHALAGADDYLAIFNVTATDLGSIEAGYKTFRTFYDGVGGFFPLADSFQKLSYEQLHVDRGSFWFKATLAKPDRPVFTLSFQADTRTGQKDSTEWAAIVNPNAVISKGALVGTAAPANTPFVAPNVLNLGEHHQVLEASMVTTVGKVTDTLKASLDWVNNNDWRSYVKYPGSTVLADPTVTVLDDQRLIKTNSFRVLNQTDVKFNDHVALDVGLTYSHQSSTNGGQWTNPAYSTTLKQVYVAMYAANIYGGAKVDSFVGNVFLNLTPTKNWLINLGFRDENSVIGSSGGFTTTSLATGATSLASSNFHTTVLGHFDGNPVNLAPLSPKDLAPLYVEMMGGSAKIIAKGRQLAAEGKYLLAMEIFNRLVFAEPQNKEVRALLADVYEQLGYQSESTSARNTYLQGAFELRNGLPGGTAARSTGPDMVRAMSTENWLDFLGISMDPKKADGLRFTINLITPDNSEKYLVEMSNATLTNIKGEQAKNPDLTITLNRADLNMVMMGVNSFDDLIAAGKAKFDGDRKPFDQLRSLMVSFTPDFESFRAQRRKRRRKASMRSSCLTCSARIRTEGALKILPTGQRNDPGDRRKAAAFDRWHAG